MSQGRPPPLAPPLAQAAAASKSHPRHPSMPPPAQPRPISEKIEVIKQYYQQLTTSYRAVTIQLERGGELQPAKKSELLAQQAKIQRSLNDFTNRVLKPLTAASNIAQPNSIQQPGMQVSQMAQRGQMSNGFSPNTSSTHLPMIDTKQDNLSMSAPWNPRQPMTAGNIPRFAPTSVGHGSGYSRSTGISAQASLDLSELDELPPTPTILPCSSGALLSPPQLLQKKLSKDLPSIANRKRLSEYTELIVPDPPTISREAEKMIWNWADDFLDNLIRDSCVAAIHRKSPRLEKQDITLTLDRVYNIPTIGRVVIPTPNRAQSKKNTTNASQNPHSLRMMVLKKHLASQNHD